MVVWVSHARVGHRQGFIPEAPSQTLGASSFAGHPRVRRRHHAPGLHRPPVTPVRGGAVWQLVGLITRRSQVQILPPLPPIPTIPSHPRRVLSFSQPFQWLDLERLHIVPEPFAVGPDFGRSIRQQHFGMDDAALLGEVLHAPQPLVAHPRGRAVGGRRHLARSGLAADRKLPRQAGISKVELPATRWRYSAGVRSPSESWGRSSLYSSIHQYAASRTSSRRVNRCWSRTSSRKVRLKRSM